MIICFPVNWLYCVHSSVQCMKLVTQWDRIGSIVENDEVCRLAPSEWVTHQNDDLGIIVKGEGPLSTEQWNGQPGLMSVSEPKHVENMSELDRSRLMSVDFEKPCFSTKTSAAHITNISCRCEIFALDLSSSSANKSQQLASYLVHPYLWALWRFLSQNSRFVYTIM